MIKKLTAIFVAVVLLLVSSVSFTAPASEADNLLQAATVVSASPSGGANSTKAVNMFDGNDTTYFQTWSSATAGTYVLDLGDTQAFSRLTLLKPKSAQRAHKLSLKVSEDNSLWNDVIMGALVPMWGGVEISFDFPAVSARYVTIIVHDIVPVNGYNGFSISEIRLYEADSAIESNILRNAPVIFASVAEGVEIDGIDTHPLQMFDGDLSTAFAAGGITEATFTVDAGEEKAFNTLKLAKGSKYPGTFDLKIEGSPDNSAWEVLHEETSVSGGSSEEAEYFMGEKNARYIRFVFSNAENSRIDIAELQLLNAEDTTPPVITLNGEVNADLDLGEEYSEPGYSAWDNRDGDVTGNVDVSGDTVDSGTRGIYEIVYTVYDSAGNKGEAIRTVGVGIDTTPPVITLIGASEIVVGLGGVYTEPGYVAEDNFDGIITENVVISGDEVNVDTVGSYIVKYDVCDSSGNKAVTVERLVRVVEYEYGTNLCSGAELVGGSKTGGDSTVTENIFDGDVETRYRSWIAEGRTGEFVLDFGEAKTFNQLVAIQPASAARYYTLTLQTGESSSGPWTNVAEPVAIAANASESTSVNFPAVSTRYVRFYVDKVDPAYNYYNIAELQLYMNKALYALSADAEEIRLPLKTGVGIELLQEGIYGSEISWTSSDPDIMTDNGNIVSRPAYGEVAKTVTLTAKLTYEEAFITKSFDVRITPQNPAEDAFGAENEKAICDGDYSTAFAVENGSEIEFEFEKVMLTGFVKLETEERNKVTGAKIYAWNKSGYILLDSDYDIENSELEFTAGNYDRLKILFETDGITEISELIFTVSDIDAVDYLADNLTVSEEPLNKITKDLILPKKGDCGQKVTWESSDTSVILDNGTVFRDSKNRQVTVTAVITKGEAKRTVDFDITVLKESSSKNPGGGGGGGSRGGAVVPFTEPIKPVASPEAKPEGSFGMNSSHWAYLYVKKLANAGIVSGNQNGDFEPEKEITRAEFVKMLVMASGAEITSAVQPFADVDSDAWYAPYVNTARSIGIITGDDLNCANPNELISRQDMAVMLGRTLEILSMKSDSVRAYESFADEDFISGYARAYIRNLYCTGIIDGMTGGVFEPFSPATKAQAAKLVASVI